MMVLIYNKSCKNNFQSVINNYQVSIDSKIDKAIADYLSGIKVQSDIVLENYINKYIPTTEGASYLINSDLIAKISS